MSKFAGVLCAVLLHVGFILFGGWLFLGEKEDHGTLQEVELLAEDDAEAEKEKKEEPAAEKTEEMETEAEEAPDSAEIIRNLELSAAAAAAAPALEEASLSAIEQALGGQGGGGGGDFADALSFASGGRIGGTGRAGALDGDLERAFSLAEIDQKPRLIFQSTPLFPAEMRGKKVEGVVTVIFVVDATGKVGSPRVEKSSHPAFEKPALDAVRKWKFEPAIRGGQRVGCKLLIPIRFEAS